MSTPETDPQTTPASDGSIGSPTQGQRLRKAGWQKRKYGWKSPYTLNVLPQDEAIRTEDFMAREPASENSVLDRTRQL